MFKLRYYLRESVYKWHVLWARGDEWYSISHHKTSTAALDRIKKITNGAYWPEAKERRGMETNATPSRPPTPELDIMLETSDESMAIDRFLEWLAGEGYMLAVTSFHDIRHASQCREHFRGIAVGEPADCEDCRNEEQKEIERRGTECYGRGECPLVNEGWHYGRMRPASTGSSNLLYAYFNIDPDTIENERVALMEYVRALNEASEGRPE